MDSLVLKIRNTPRVTQMKAVHSCPELAQGFSNSRMQYNSCKIYCIRRKEMAKRTTKQNDKPVTTAQKLGSVVKSARDIMRTDKGLNGELDRLPQLTWIMFLKLLDDSEKLHEVEAELEGISYKSTIQLPYRWRDWAED